MTLEQVRREVEPQGFIFKESLEFLPWQHVIIFEKPAEARREQKTVTAPPGRIHAPKSPASGRNSRSSQIA